MKSRTPSDCAIVAIFQDKRNPQNAAQSAFPLDLTGILPLVWRRCRLLQGGLSGLRPALDKRCKFTRLSFSYHTISCGA
ncbi:hypothetical protein BN2475_230059 [Paraburkholderia ribeironis]|uniref:Uncharacterized protein n=1 Tax=Paraburkholderia ribeironis TaxID=1247936 RepID=A0A1N7RXZ8_9BURK|nr:hypothetical protein [Paraburkholderia ribeironis]SIT39924.1 hypothetical protein BN2475_230059 [Paraburkholderia ribeironis]